MLLSVITVSREPAKVARLQASVTACFAGEASAMVEVIVLDGSRFDLFTGYNEGARQATGEVLLFTHDDVRLLGNSTSFAEPLRLVRKPLTGVVGVAGATVMPKDGCWWHQDHPLLRGAVHHPSAGPFEMHLNVWPFQAGRFGRVAVCDGVLLLIAKRNFEKIGGFSEDQYQGFHFYDMDLSVKAAVVGLRNYVAPIPVYHGSPGIPNANWEANREKFVARWAPVLPLTVPGE